MRRIKWVPSSTMDVRGANTFPLHNRLPITPFWSRRPSYPLAWGFIYIFPFLLEQIKLGGDFTSFREFKRFLKIELLQLATSLGTIFKKRVNPNLILRLCVYYSLPIISLYPVDI